MLPVNEFSGEPSRDVMPPKPKKLTPIFSKKRSEIMQQSVMNGSSLNIGEEQMQMPTIKKSKKINRTPRENTNGLELKKKGKKKASNRVNQGGEANNYEEEPNYQEMDETEKSSKFDQIWDPEQLAPKMSISRNNTALSTIGEEFAPIKMSRTKSYLGGKVAKLDDENISHLDANKPITYKKKSKPEMNYNDNTGLVNEFDRNQSSSHTFED